MEKLSYIPFGAQYYRYPTPVPADWESDMANMRDAGFNTIKIWSLWRTNNPREGEYDFSDIDRLMDLAHENGLKVIINAIFDVAPAWFYQKYPDCLMTTSSGRKLTPASNASRQTGGSPGPCLHHEAGVQVRMAFLHALAERYSEHPALWCWDIWNEPEASGAMADGLREENLLCYCDNSRRAFIAWLSERYEGDIARLNARWNMTYNDWSEVELPRIASAFNNMIEWREFMTWTVTNEARLRVECVKTVDKKHPVMLHTVPMPYFNAVTACSDDCALAKLCDLYGNSLGSMPFTATITMSAADGKPAISSEIHAVGGSTFGRPNVPTPEAFRRHIFIPLSKGIKGFQFWQYRPERLGVESPAWGLTWLDGSAAPQLGYAADINRALQANSDVLLEAMPRPTEIAVINSNKGQVFTWCADGAIDKYCESVKGVFDGLHDNNLSADVLSPDHLTSERLAKYKVVYFPFPYYMEQRVADVVREWVVAGGTLVSEAFFAGVCDTDGLHAAVVPGFGMDEVFGARDRLVMTASSFNNAYSARWSSEDSDANFIRVDLTDGVPGMADGTLSGYYFSEGLEPYDGTQVLARFEDGRPAAVSHTYGKGRAVLIGTLLGCAVQRGPGGANGRFLSSFALAAGVQPTARVDRDGIRADGLYRGGKLAAAVVTNNTGAACSPAVTLNSAPGDNVTDAVTGERIRARLDGDVLTVYPDLGKDDCVLWMIQT